MNLNSTDSYSAVISPDYDPWDPIRSLQRYGKHKLTSIEVTITNLCNMRCEHCAVGNSLTMQEGQRIPLKELLKSLDEVKHLETISITGGEPTYHFKTVKEYIVPLLQYAKDRGIKSQLNTNLTLDLSRYEWLAPYLDVFHISFNYLSPDDYYQIGFEKSVHPVSKKTALKLYETMCKNTSSLSRQGMFVSAESMINYRTFRHLPEIHQMISEMGCKRHEVHPMYPSDFAKELPQLSLGQLREAILHLLDHREKSLWMLFGTLPFYQCSELLEDRSLLNRLRVESNVTIRNDPDGRNRLNINLFTGDLMVTDFANLPPVGNLLQDRLDDVFDRWQSHPLQTGVNCYCPEANCCGPNLLVKNAYYSDVNFQTKKAKGVMIPCK